MSKKSAAHLTTTGVNVPMGVILAVFPKKEITNKNVVVLRLFRQMEQHLAGMLQPLRSKS